MTIMYAYGYFDVIEYDDGTVNENEISAYDDLPELVPLNGTSNIDDEDEYADMPDLITPDEYTYDYTYDYSYFYNQ